MENNGIVLGLLYLAVWHMSSTICKFLHTAISADFAHRDQSHVVFSVVWCSAPTLPISDEAVSTQMLSYRFAVIGLPEGRRVV
jgi:hypothetical protein